jgi:rubrerythrin
LGTRGHEETEPDDFVEFFRSGQAAAGEFRCSECGYGVIVQRTLPACPMCGGEAWEQPPLRTLRVP